MLGFTYILIGCGYFIAGLGYYYDKNTNNVLALGCVIIGIGFIGMGIAHLMSLA